MLDEYRNSGIVDFLFVTESFDALAPSARAIAETMPLFFLLLLISSFIVIFFARPGFLKTLELSMNGRSRAHDPQLT